MGLREQAIIGCFPEFVFQFSIAQVLVGCDFFPHGPVLLVLLIIIVLIIRIVIIIISGPISETIKGQPSPILMKHMMKLYRVEDSFKVSFLKFQINICKTPNLSDL